MATDTESVPALTEVVTVLSVQAGGATKSQQ
jgi:hypothetical protein